MYKTNFALFCGVLLPLCSGAVMADQIMGDYCSFGQGENQTNLPFTLVKPNGLTPQDSLPAVILIHGGSWSGGKRSGLMAVANELAQSGYVAATIDYRLTNEANPDNPDPMKVAADYRDIIVDVKCAVRHFKAQAASYNIDPEKIVVFGSSAGGHLAAQIGLSQATWEDENGQYSSVSSSVVGVVNWFGPTNLRHNYMQVAATRGSIEALLGGTPSSVAERYVAASPIMQVDANDPPMLTVHGVLDATVPYQESVDFHQKLNAVGGAHTLVLLEDAEHGFVNHPSTDPASPYGQAMLQTKAFLAELFL